MDRTIIMNETIIPILDKVFNGKYLRVAFAKAGTIVIGCTHKKQGNGFLLSGSIRQSNDDGSYCDFKAPYCFETSSGSQRVALALEDCIYATIHNVLAIDEKEAEVELFVEQPQITRIQNDYNNFLLESGLTEPELEDCIIEENDNIYFAKSSINGIGCFSNRDINQGEVIAIAFMDGTRLSTSRYVNHSDIPNIRTIKSDEGNIFIMSLVDIEKDNELFLDYRKGLICQQ